tara:strand:- start:2019 stop:2399 length:381 start_codon:yes stop_codon:yes gene_type:complete
MKRFYDETSACWFVYRDYILPFVQVAVHSGHAVDYASLPDDIKQGIDSEKGNWQHVSPSGPEIAKVKPMSVNRAFKILHLRQSAPDFVVKAAYRALSLKHHPDQGGEAEVFKKINTAYQLLREREE